MPLKDKTTEQEQEGWLIVQGPDQLPTKQFVKLTKNSANQWALDVYWNEKSDGQPARSLQLTRECKVVRGARTKKTFLEDLDPFVFELHTPNSVSWTFEVISSDRKTLQEATAENEDKSSNISSEYGRTLDQWMRWLITALGPPLYNNGQTDAGKVKKAVLDLRLSTLGQTSLGEDDFLAVWFPNLMEKSYILPPHHIPMLHTISKSVGTATVLQASGSELDAEKQKIVTRDRMHRVVHEWMKEVEDLTASESKGEVMVAFTQTMHSMYQTTHTSFLHGYEEEMKSLEKDLLKRRSRSPSPRSTNKTDPTTDILTQKTDYADLVAVNHCRGVLLGKAVQRNALEPSELQQDIERAVKKLDKAESIVRGYKQQQYLQAEDETEAGKSSKSPSGKGLKDFAVHKVVLLTEVSRQDAGFSSEKVILPKRFSLLFGDELSNKKQIRLWLADHWMQTSPQDFLTENVYRLLVTRFAIQATKVKIYLTSQPRLQLKHTGDVISARGDILGAEVFSPGHHHLTLYPRQLSALSRVPEEGDDDVRMLVGPPGSGKTILLILRAQQWVTQYQPVESTVQPVQPMKLFVLETSSQDGTAAAYMVQHQLRMSLQDRKCDIVHMTFKSKKDKSNLDTLIQELTEQRRVFIVADEADSKIIFQLYEKLKARVEGATVFLWAATVKKPTFPDDKQNRQEMMTDALRCPPGVVAQVGKARDMKKKNVYPYSSSIESLKDLEKRCSSVNKIYHYGEKYSDKPVERNHHTTTEDGYEMPWQCEVCVNEIVSRLQQLRVGDGDRRDGAMELSLNDVFIMASTTMDCDPAVPDDHYKSPSPLVKALEKNRFPVFRLSPTSPSEDLRKTAERCQEVAAITLVNEQCVWGLERKVVVYMDGGVNTDILGRLRSLSRTTSLLIFVKSKNNKKKTRQTGRDEHSSHWSV